RDDAPRGREVQHLRERAGGRLVHLDAGVARGAHRRVLERVGLGVHLFDRGARAERLGEQHGAVDEERALLGTSAAAPREAPQPLQSRIARAQPAQLSAPAPVAAGAAASAESATPTSAAKADSSRTARSARTLRSTSTPAIRSPLTKRL